VVPELFASLNPVAYSGSMEDDERRMAAVRARRSAVSRLEEERERKSHQLSGQGRGGQPTGRVQLNYNVDRLEEVNAHLSLGKSVTSAASASRLGDYFQYAVDRPVSLARQKSALLPIVGKDVQATRVSIYNERTQARFPLLGLRFKNTSG